MRTIAGNRVMKGEEAVLEIQIMVGKERRISRKNGGPRSTKKVTGVKTRMRRKMGTMRIMLQVRRIDSGGAGGEGGRVLGVVSDREQ